MQIKKAGYMGLFGNKKKLSAETMAAAALADFEQEVVVNYDSVVDWLVGLSDEDYSKVCKVADVYRKAHTDAAGVLGTPNEPTTAIFPPEPVQPPADDTSAGSFLDHEEPKSKTAKKVRVQG